MLTPGRLTLWGDEVQRLTATGLVVGMLLATASCASSSGTPSGKSASSTPKQTSARTSTSAGTRIALPTRLVPVVLPAPIDAPNETGPSLVHPRDIVATDNSVVVGGETGYPPVIWRSTDGTHWLGRTLPGTKYTGPTRMAAHGNTIIAVDDENSGGAPHNNVTQEWISSDGGVDWRQVSPPGSGSTMIWGLGYARGLWFAGGTDDLWTSTDGIAWQASGVPVPEAERFAANAKTFVVVSTEGVWTAHDGHDWIKVSESFPPTVDAQDGAVTESGGHIVAVLGQEHTAFMQTDDGLSWSMLSPPGSSGVCCITALIHIDSGFIAVGFNNQVWTSSEGRNWRPVADSSGEPSFTNVAVFGDHVYAIGADTLYELR
jgi:hypothetical protein